MCRRKGSAYYKGATFTPTYAYTFCVGWLMYLYSKNLIGGHKSETFNQPRIFPRTDHDIVFKFLGRALLLLG